MRGIFIIIVEAEEDLLDLDLLSVCVCLSESVCLLHLWSQGSMLTQNKNSKKKRKQRRTANEFQDVWLCVREEIPAVILAFSVEGRFLVKKSIFAKKGFHFNSPASNPVTPKSTFYFSFSSPPQPLSSPCVATDFFFSSY